MIKKPVCQSNNKFINLQCLHHPGNTIHNFCANSECLLPMCATCVGIHSIQHQQSNSFPHFVSLQDMLDEVKQNLNTTCQQLQQYSHIYTNDYWNKQKMGEQCKKRINQLKVKVIREVEHSFSSLEINIYKALEEFDQKMHKKYRVLQQQIQYLYQSIKLQLSGLQNKDKLIKNLILFNLQNQSQSITQWMTKFQNNIQQLRKQSIKITTDPQLFTLIQKAINYITPVQFIDKDNEYLQTNPRHILKSDRSFIEQTRGSQ